MHMGPRHQAGPRVVVSAAGAALAVEVLAAPDGEEGGRDEPDGAEAGDEDAGHDAGRRIAGQRQDGEAGDAEDDARGEAADQR